MESTSDLVQIIDGDGQFISIDHFNQLVSQYHLLDKAFDYYIVAILGPQSSGKSTLLNLLFNTGFQTLEASGGRVQVTKGIWMGHCDMETEKKEAIVVFDVEGVDGRERGEKEQSFERKTSLFSLALAEVLIVNMWHNDVGRYNAGNIALLKTVFEQNLLLFGRSKGKKTLILFVIRDHIALATPMDKLQEIIMKDMYGIWETLQKPDAFKNTQVSDFFTFMFTGLPHKLLEPTQFVSAVGDLRKRFVDPKNADFILHTEHFQKDIPADGLAPYASRIWQTIKENKDLDLPSQKEMLAMFRCDEILETISKQFNSSIAPFKSQLEKSQVEDFGRKVTEIYNTSLAAYDAPASRYHPEVASRKRATLTSTMNTELHSLFEKQIQRISEKTIGFFDKLLQEAFPSDAPASENFTETIATVVNNTYEFFESRAKASLLESSDWTYSDALSDLKTQVQNKVKEARDQQLDKLFKEIKTQLSSSLSKPLDKALDAPSDKMWEDLRNFYENSKTKALDALETRLKGFQVEEKEEADLKKKIQDIAFEAIKDRFSNKANSIKYVISKKFGDLFNLDEKGLPRRWKQGDDVRAIFLEAKTKTLKVLEAYSLIRLKEEMDTISYLEEGADDVDKKHIVIPHEEAVRIKDDFERDANSAYLSAVRDQEQVASAAHVPMYIILLIMVLGFNEFVHILTSPILLLLTIIIGIGGYVLYMLNLMGPAKKVMEALLHTSLSTLQQYVSEQMNKQYQNQQQQVTASGEKPKSD